MTEFILADALIRFLQITPPADWTGVVRSVRGHVIEIEEVGGGAPAPWDADPVVAQQVWRGAVAAINDGNAEGLRNVVVASPGNQLIVWSPFMSGRAPEPGDSITLQSGPLATAWIGDERPDTLAPMIPSYSSYVTVTPVTGDEAWAGLGGRSYGGVSARQSIYGFEIMVERKLKTDHDASGTHPTVYDLTVLKTQILALLHQFKVDSTNHMIGGGEVSWGRFIEQPPGGPSMDGYVIEFDIMFKT